MGEFLHRQRWRLLTLFIVLFFAQGILVLRNGKTQHWRPMLDNVNVTFKVKMKPGLLNLINPSVPKYPLNVQYIHENEKFCSSVGNLTLLVLVLSATTNFNRRQALRQTWANKTLYKSYGTLEVLFLLGVGNDTTVQNKIEKEYEHFGDIVQGDFIDTYRNLTHKSTMGLKWATERCRNAKYVIKTDDDVVINIFHLFHNTILSESANKFHVYCHRQSTPVVRDESHKFFIDHCQFKGIQRFPTYCGGLFVMILNDLVPSLYMSVSQTPFFWLEDVLLYGLALNNIPGVQYRAINPDHIQFLEWYDVNNALKCLHKKKKNCPYFIFVTATPKDIMKLWKAISQLYSSS